MSDYNIKAVNGLCSSRSVASLDALNAAEATEASAQLLALTFDPDAYAHYVAEFDLTEDQKQELLQIIWNTVVAAVDLGFRIHPVQKALAGRTDAAELAHDSEAMLASFNAQANPSTTTSAARPNGRQAGED